MTRAKIGALAAALGLMGLTGLTAAATWPPASASISVRDGQLCVRTTCLTRSGHVVTYQPQPDLASAPPSVGR